MRLLRLPALLVLALVPLAACGDDDDGGGGGALSKEEFIEAGDAICREASEDGQSIDEPAANDAEDLSRFLEEAIEVVGTARSDFAALDAPADGEAVQQLEVDALADSVATLEDAKAESDAGDYDAARGIVQAADPEAEAREPLQEYGFEVCGAE
ncbi:MAG TPA: hypothetical protein VJ804_11500 [Acidimicrobiales bacterium]|nr:hypothetical protein [Acidimicrobiales bacterium]